MRLQLFRKDEGDRAAWERGQAMVEVALLLPFVFILLMMVIEFGFLMWTNLNVNASAREAARFAAVGNLVGIGTIGVPDTPDCKAAGDPASVGTVRGRAKEASLERIPCGEVVVTYRNTTADPGGTFYGRGDEVVVEINHQYDGLTPMANMMAAWGWGGPSGTITIRACADARLERSYDPLRQAEIVAATTSCG